MDADRHDRILIGIVIWSVSACTVGYDMIGPSFIILKSDMHFLHWEQDIMTHAILCL